MHLVGTCELIFNVAQSFILMTPLGLETVGINISLHEPLSVMDHPGLRLLPCQSLSRIGPQSLSQS